MSRLFSAVFKAPISAPSYIQYISQNFKPFLHGLLLLIDQALETWTVMKVADTFTGWIISMKVIRHHNHLHIAALATVIGCTEHE